MQLDQNPPSAPKKKEEEGLWDIIKILLEALLITFVVRSFIFQPFNVPTGSLIPTVLIGDYIFATKYAYGFSKYSLPFSPNLFSGRIFASEPKRGDIVVFRLPRDPNIDYVKRLIGLPGDKIQMLHGRLFINGTMVEREQIKSKLLTDSYGREVEQPTYVETLPGGVKHEIVEISGDNGTYDNTELYEVPPGNYFMMGDNRDNSLDSRVPPDREGVGYVPFENLVGRGEFVIISVKENHSWWEVWNWPGIFRGDRFFHRLN